jgi:hypothetical protein
MGLRPAASRKDLRAAVPAPAHEAGVPAPRAERLPEQGRAREIAPATAPATVEPVVVAAPLQASPPAPPPAPPSAAPENAKAVEAGVSRAARDAEALAAATPAHAEATVAPAGPTSEPETVAGAATARPSTAGLTALILFAWGQSLLLFEWSRREIFEPTGASHLLVVLPFFGGAAAAAVLAVLARRAGRAPLGGPLVQQFGVASGLLGLFGLILTLHLGPTVKRVDDARRERVTHQQLRVVAEALEHHRREHGSYPIGEGVEALLAALAPEFLADASLLRDAWGHAMAYRSLNIGGGYLLLSLGPDGAQDIPDASYAEGDVPPGLENDIVVLSGSLISPPRPAGPDVP